MESGKKFITCEDARDMDLVSFLSSLGFEPVKIRNQDYWYLSPLRSEKTPSFKVNRKLNRWYDHGLGKGGNLVDFGILFRDCTVREFLELLGSSNVPFRNGTSSFIQQDDSSSQLIILHETDLKSAWLLNYLKTRLVPPSVARLYCREVTYQVKSKTYNAIGFKNDAGGYELRNPNFKGSCSPKDITTFPHSTKELAVFEGFFDFLSFMAMLPFSEQKQTDFLILNSLSFFKKSRTLIEGYDRISLYLDRDKSGHNCSLLAQSFSKKYIDRSDLYKGYKDVNDWAVHMGKRPHRLGRYP